MDLNTRTLRAPLQDRQKIAIILLGNGVSLDEISKTTGLTHDDLRKLRDDVKT